MHQPSLAVIDIVGLPYDGSTLEKRGLGGSESCVIYLTRELAQLGFAVTVYCRCDEEDNEPGMYAGVEYRPISEAVTTDRTFDVIISSRTIEPFVKPEYAAVLQRASWKMLWMHDTFLWGDNEMEQLVVSGAIDEIICLSDWHAAYVLNCNHGKKRNYEMLKKRTYMFRNCMGHYVHHVNIEAKNPDLFVYNASVSKGMCVLLEDVWPEIRKQIPGAQLKIIGGFYRFPERTGPDEQEKTWQRLRDQNHGKHGVEFTGVIRQSEIAEILAEATWFLYPTEFPETFGISTLEAQAYNCVPLTTRFGGLEEVAMDSTSYKLDYSVTPNAIFPAIDRAAQVEKFVHMVVKAYHNPYVRQQKQYAGHALRSVLGWDTAATQFTQHVYRVLGWYLPVDLQRRARQITTDIQRLFGRRNINPEDVAQPKQSQEWPIYVVSPFRNSAEYLQQHIHSVAAQDYDNWHHILIDDASDDHSAEVVRNTINSLPAHMHSRYTVVVNQHSHGAVRNQIHSVRTLIEDDNAIVVLLDGDDFLVNEPDVFDRINYWHQSGSEFTYGSCWSMADDIPLVAQPYPPEVLAQRAYRQHKFTWGIPYTHLRTFRRRLLNSLEDTVFQHPDGEWFGAGGDVATFYNIIEQADPDSVRAVTDILVRYNDTNPNNDYKVNSEEQNRTAAAISAQQPSYHTQEQPMPPRLHSAPTQKLSDLTQRSAPRVSVPQRRVLIGMPTGRYIESDTFRSLWDLSEPEGYTTEFQYFYGYSRVQVMNLMAKWALNYDYTLFVRPDIVLDSDLLTDMIAADTDIAVVDNHTVVGVKHRVFADLVPQPCMVAGTSRESELEQFVQTAVAAGATVSHQQNRTQRIVCSTV